MLLLIKRIFIQVYFQLLKFTKFIKQQTDIDIVPANGLREKFLEFANKKMLFENSEKKLSAFVVPVFEIKKDGEVPNNKQELLEKV